MFVQPSNLKSTSIETLKIDVPNNTVVVKFLNGAANYIYQNVAINTIVDYFHDELSAGEFVNEIKSQEGVQLCYLLIVNSSWMGTTLCPLFSPYFLLWTNSLNSSNCPGLAVAFTPFKVITNIADSSPSLEKKRGVFGPERQTNFGDSKNRCEVKFWDLMRDNKNSYGGFIPSKKIMILCVDNHKGDMLELYDTSSWSIHVARLEW